VSSHASSSPFRQPRAVWAVAFACVISFMGIGLVDPILPALSQQLHATPSQVTLLFTSYLVVTAVAMLITGWVSSRLGAKNTLVLGLGLIVVFAFLAGASNGIGGIVGFRAGWGLGNALFIATSLAVIVGSASGGFAGAIVLYETALGVGIACGPLLGALLGSWSRRGPFFGVSVLMAIALVATLVLVPRTPKPAHRASLGEPLRALRHRGLLTMGVTALLYNWGFFTMLGYVPFPMGLSIYGLGAVFFGWGVLVALFSVFVAPRLQARFGTAPVLYVNLALFAVLLAVIATFIDSPATLRDLRRRRGRLHRHQQHADHAGRDARRAGRTAGRLRGVRVHPLHRRRSRPVGGGRARRALHRAGAVLPRRGRGPAGGRCARDRSHDPGAGRRGACDRGGGPRGRGGPRRHRAGGGPRGRHGRGRRAAAGRGAPARPVTRARRSGGFTGGMPGTRWGWTCTSSPS
jgi:ACDE family multidrug resistance protein